MWSGQYNPLHSFDALFSSSGHLDNLEPYHGSGSRMELPGGGFIELPGIETTQEQNDPFDGQDSHLFQDNLESKTSSGSRIELPGGGYIELPSGIETRELNSQPRCNSDIFQDVGFGARPAPVYRRNQNIHTVFFSKLQELEDKLEEKDRIIRQQESKNMILREHLNRLVQIADERNMELCKLRYEANGAFNELQSRITQLNNQVENLKDEVNQKDAECSEMHCQVKLVSLQRSMLTKEREERKSLQEKIKVLEKSIQDLTTKNNILENELTVLPNMMAQTASPKTAVKAQVHQPTVTRSGEPKRRRSCELVGYCQTVDEQKLCHPNLNEDPELIEILESHSTPALDAVNQQDSNKKTKKSFKQWLRKKAQKSKQK